MTNLRLSVDVSSLDTEEVLMVLAEHFGSASMGEGRISFQRQDSSADVEISRRGRVVRIWLGPRMTHDEEDTIQRKLEGALIEGQHTVVGQHVGFCSHRVKGYYRYREELQIMPVPDEAPRSDVRLADHPFLLQHTYTWSPEHMVRNRRRLDQARFSLRLLDLLSGARIHGGSRVARHEWVMPGPVQDPSRWKSEWRQLGYIYSPGFPAEIECFSDMTDHEPLVFVPTEQHFARPGVTGDPLELPDDIETALDLAFDLRGEDRERFQRALIYLEHAKSVLEESRSLAYIALVMAIEALMDKPERCEACDQALLEKKPRCAACGQPVFSTTRTFREFLETHAPIIRDEPGIGNRLYGLRSDLAHGNDVMRHDMSALTMYARYAEEEYTLESTLDMIAGTAIRNWLHSRVST